LRFHAFFLIAGLVLLAAVLAVSTTATNVSDTIVRNTVRISLVWYTAALLLMMRLTDKDWRAETLRGRITRWCWTWAVLCFLVHLCMAFHHFHHWSHTHAFDHTEAVSGIGAGIFTLYVFVGLGLTDALWWWIRPQQYAARSAWIDRTLHAFMLFIVFNGMVIFETGPIRWAGIIMFATLAAAWLTTRGLPGKERAA
jgi:hypothetical protein